MAKKEKAYFLEDRNNSFADFINDRKLKEFGSSLENVINSISKKHKYSTQAEAWAREWLIRNGKDYLF